MKTWQFSYNDVIIVARKCFDEPVKMISEHGNIRKITNGQGDEYTSGCLVDYPYFKENYKVIAIDLIKRQALDTD